MFFRIRKPFWLMLTAAIVLAASIFAVEFSGMCKLNDIMLADNLPSGYIIDASDYKGKNLLDISLEDVADQILDNKKIMKVDIAYSLPSKLKVTCNDIDPIALVIPEGGRTLYQLDCQCRLLPFESDEINMPIITGAKKCKLYKTTGDKSLMVLSDQLRRIKSDFNDFYLAISNIEIKSGDKIVFYLDGLPFGIKTYTGMMNGAIKRLKLFLMEYNPDLDGIKYLDMRLNNTIIATG